MKTAELLEGMTDAALFERLATQVLRKAETRFEAIIHLGINARGLPVAASNDGFCQIPESDPPQFLWVQHTIESRDRLREKWLSENHEEPGDLIKAAREADKLRAQFLTGKFIVILSTNQRLPTEKRNKNLANDIYAAAAKLGIEAIIWEQSRYRDFLDSHRDGQWFRKEFFGIETEWLSEELLASLSRKSLIEYANQQFTPPSHWVVRQLDQRLSQPSGDELHTIKLILGESGHGKSAAAYRFLHNHITAGGYGLYIPENIIELAISLEDALRQILHKLYPSLLASEVDAIPANLTPKMPFVIVVDDVNKSSNPSELIRKLVSWSRAPYLIVCPAWPRFWKAVKADEIQAKVDVISIERMSFDEAIEAVRSVTQVAGRSVTAIDVQQIAGRLRCDPLLIGAFGQLLSRKPEAELAILADNVVETYIRQYVAAAEAGSKGKYFEHEYYGALEQLTATMLREKNLYPNWSTIEEWLQNEPKQLDILRDLARHGKICQVSAGEFRFQHDRFLEYFSIKAIGLLLPHPDDHQNILAEPYYAELIGRALGRYPQSDAVLDRIRWLHPLALAFSIGEIGTPTTDYHRTVIRKLQEWVQYAGRNSSTPESLRGEVANCFINTDSPAVLDIVHTNFGLEVSWLGDMARLRNGDVESGVKLFEVVGTDYRKGSLVTELVEHAKRYHESRVRADLLQYLGAVTEERRFKGATILAGYLALPDLPEAIVANWHRQAQRTRHLDIVIWAVLRSVGPRRGDPTLTTLFNYWEAMPDTPEVNKASEQSDTAQGLQKLFSAEADQELATYLVEQAIQRPGLRPAIAHLCGQIDIPDAIEFATREDAQLEDWQHHSSLTHWASFDNPRLSPASVTRLKQLWSDEENQDTVRKVAFHIWIANVDRNAVEVLSLIQPIPADAPFYVRTLQERALLGDTTCVSALLEELQAYPGLYYVMPPVWGESLKQAVALRLQSFAANIPADFSGGVLNEHYLLAPVLTEIPVPDAEYLLSKFWAHLRYSRLFLQAAAFIGSPTTLALVDQVINDYPADVDPFQYLDTIYGFFDRSREKRLTLEHLKHLEPYLGRMKYEEQFPCGEFCYRQGGDYLAWAIAHLSLEVNNVCRNRYNPTEEDILNQLNGPITHLPNHAVYLLDKFRKQNDPARFLDILRRWLQGSPTWQKVEAAAHCIEEIGARADVSMLDVQLEYTWEIHHAEMIKESARFAISRRILS